MNQLILKKNQLPIKTEDLFKFILVGKEKLRAQQAKIRAIDKVGMAHAAKEAALTDAQDIADILLDAEAKLGEMLESVPKKREKQGSSQRTSLPSLPSGITKKDSHYAQELARNKDIIEEVKQQAREEGEIPTRTTVLKAIKKKKSDQLRENDSEPNKGTVFNATNENIDWAKWSWNPVTGCRHGCKYCYARDIANRYYKKEKFEPTFRSYRLKAPFNTQIPSERKNEMGIHNVFVCSMADLFGNWVPQEWIDPILKVVYETPQWNYIFLTKNPERMTDIAWPDNAWVGTTIDVQSRVKRAEKAFKNIKAKVKFVSCEPLSENLDFSDLTVFNWVIIGARSKSTKAPAMQPRAEWVFNLMNQAYESGCKIYCKPNLKALIKEYPF